MTTEIKLVNGIQSWADTHFEIVKAITVRLMNESSEVVDNEHEKNGTFGLYTLASELTNKFEQENIGREWHGEYFEAIDEFIEKELY